MWSSSPLHSLLSAFRRSRPASSCGRVHPSDASRADARGVRPRSSSEGFASCMPCRSLCRSASLVSLLISLAGCGAHRSPTRIEASPSHTPAYPLGKDPVVLWDLGHHNFGRVKVHEALRAWVSRDGYVVRPFRQFELAILSEADIVVIRIALAAVNDTHGFEQLEASKWILPNPSAFLPSESESVDTAGFFVFRRADGTYHRTP